jgi:tetratricopeptide (TPR) repeat protein
MCGWHFFGTVVMEPGEEGLKMTTDAIVSQERTFTKLNPNIECALRDAQNCKMAGDYQLALNLYDKVIKEDPANVRALHSKANVLDLMGNYSEAIRCYESALECDPHNAEAWYNKGMTLRKTGRHEEGLEHIRKGISLAMGDI